VIETQLQQLGFGKNEVRVYLALFDLGKTRAGAIIEQTGLHRNLVYTALEELLKKDLVSKVISSGVAVYEANSPESLQDLFEDKVQAAKEVVSELKSKVGDKPRDIKIYEGTEGIKRSRSRTLNYDPGSTLYVFGSQASSTPEMEKYWRVFHKKRVSKKIGLKILYERGVIPEDLDWRNGLPMSQAKYLPMNFNLPVWFAFIRDYLEIGVAGDDPLTFSIRSKEAVGAFENFFNFFWNQKVFVERGIEALKNAIYGMLGDLSPGEEYCVLGASSGDYHGDVQKLYDEFHTTRIKKGVVTKMLVYKESLEQIKSRFIRCGDETGKISHIKSFLSAPPTPMQINLYKNKAYFIFYGDEPTVFRFEQPEMFGSFKAYFDTLWNQEALTYSGPENVKEAYNNLFALANKNEEVVIFAAKPDDSDLSEFNMLWAEKMAPLCKKIKYIYYGDTPENLARVAEIKKRIPGAETKIVLTKQNLAISNVVIGDTALNTVWNKNPLCMVIKNQTTADSFRENFELLWDQKSYFVRGPEIVRDTWIEASEKYKEFKFIGARGYFVDRYPEYFAEVKKRVEKIPGLKWKNIVDPSARDHEINNLPWMEARYNSLGSKNPNVVWLYGNKVAVANWTETEPVVFISEDKNVVDSYNDYFDELWNKEVVVESGMEALRRVYYDMLDELQPGEGYYIFGTSTGHIPQLEEFFENYHTERIKRGVVLNMLAFADYYETARERNKRSGDPEEKISHVKKYIASPLSRMQITLFNNKARLIIFGKDPVVIYLDKPEIYLGFKTQFDDWWKKSI